MVYDVRRGGERRDREGKEGETDYRLFPAYILFVADAVAAVFVSVMLGRTVFSSGEPWVLASK